MILPRLIGSSSRRANPSVSLRSASRWAFGGFSVHFGFGLAAANSAFAVFAPALIVRVVRLASATDSKHGIAKAIRTFRPAPFHRAAIAFPRSTAVNAVLTPGPGWKVAGSGVPPANGLPTNAAAGVPSQLFDALLHQVVPEGSSIPTICVGA